MSFLRSSLLRLLAQIVIAMGGVGALWAASADYAETRNLARAAADTTDIQRIEQRLDRVLCHLETPGRPQCYR